MTRNGRNKTLTLTCSFGVPNVKEQRKLELAGCRGQGGYMSRSAIGVMV